MSGDRSVLLRLEEHGREAPRVALAGTERNEQATARYEIVGELARGGVGMVYRGRDNDIGRDVALKVLRDDLLDDPDLIQRFVEEAQIGGQLQHPGIVPVYELGLRSDARPFFAMKLVKGETLAARLAKRASPADDRRALLTAFREVGRTVAYAHARGVIHRDLKPSNVMIGRFGEVQVVDWGFAKVLRRGGVDDEGLAKKARRAVTMISTVRSGGGNAPSVAGSVMGTPAYMPPEQALGRVEDLDERSDLFSLGAILCEILTGDAPYTSASGEGRLVAAAEARLDPALARLEACDADPELVALCRRCLEPLPKDRPARADVIADEVATYLTRAEGRAHAARLRAIRAESNADALRRARRFTTLLGSSVVAAVVILAAALLWVDAHRTRRAQQRRGAIEEALQEAARLRTAKQWPAALAAVERAAALGHRDSLADTIRLEAEEAARTEKRLGEERALLDDLERARAMAGDHYEDEEIDAAYVAAIEKLWPGGKVDTARLEASARAADFAAAFDSWALLRRDAFDHADWEAVNGWAQAIDPESNDLRAAMVNEDGPALAKLLEEEDLRTLPVARIAVAGGVLAAAGEREAALAFLLRAQRLHPDEFWINMRLAWVASKLKDHALHVRHRVAALAIRPESLEARHWLGVALDRSGDREGALEVWRDALAREPAWIHGSRHVAGVLMEQGRLDEALSVSEGAVLRDPDSYETWLSLGTCQVLRHRVSEALESLRKAAEIRPDSFTVQVWLARALTDAGAFGESEAACRSAIDLAGDDPEGLASSYCALSKVLMLQDRLDEAHELARKAVELAPEFAWAHSSLGLSLQARGELDLAIGPLERARELAPDSAASLQNLGFTHIGRFVRSGSTDAATLDRAIRLLRQAIALDPYLAVAHASLGEALHFAGKTREAVDVLEKAIALDPDQADARSILGRLLISLGRSGEAIPHLVKAHELTPGDAQTLRLLAMAYEATDQAAAALEAMRRAAAIDPGKQALELGRMLQRLGRTQDALAEYRRAVDLDEQNGAARYCLGTLLYQAGRLREAVVALEEAIALAPDHAEAWCNLGLSLRDLGRWEEAVEKLRKGHELGMARGNWGYPSAGWIAETERMAALAPRLERALEGDDVEATPAERTLLAEMLRVRGRLVLSVQFYREAFRGEASLSTLPMRLLYQAFRTAAGGGEPVRLQALEWGRELLRRIRALLGTDPARAFRETSSLRRNAELRSIRDTDDLPPGWTEFWAEVDVLREQARAATLPRTAQLDGPFVGFNVVSPRAGESLVVLSVHDGSPAAAAGIRPGDVVVRLGDREVSDFPSFKAAIGRYRPADTVTIELRRGEERVELRLTLARMGDFVGR